MTDNTLTNLIPDIYASKDVVSQEPVALIQAVTNDPSLARGSIGQLVRSVLAPAVSSIDFTRGQLPPDTGEQVFTNRTFALTREKIVPMKWNGDEQRGLDTGPGHASMFADQLTQAMRTLRNDQESDLAGLYVKASNAIDPSGTTLFDAANYNDMANANKCLLDNGAPVANKKAILNTSAGAALRGNAQYAGANTAGREDIVRQGILADVHGMHIGESAQINSVTAGDASSSTVNDDGYAIGATVLTLTAVGTGAILAGDVISFAGDTNKYVVASGDADVSDGGTITLGAPGLKVAMSAATKAITVDASTDKNMIFTPDAIQLSTRLIDYPNGKDSAADSMVISDPVTGANYELRLYYEFGQVFMTLGLVWGYEVLKPEHFCLLID